MSNCTNCENPYLNTGPSPFNVNEPYGTYQGKPVDIYTQNGGSSYTPIFNPSFKIGKSGYCNHCNCRYVNWNQHLGVCSKRINISIQTANNSAGFTVTEEPINPNLPVTWGGSGEIIVPNRASINTSGTTPSIQVKGGVNTIPINLSINNPLTTSLNSIQTTQCPGNYCTIISSGGTETSTFSIK